MKTLVHKPSASTVTLIFLSIALISFIYLVIYPKEFQLQSFLAACGRTDVDSVTTVDTNFIDKLTVKPDFRLFIGILSRADLYERRHLLRLLYSLQTNLTAHVDVRFVFCKLYKEDQQTMVALEIMKYNDIIILDCPENMNEGKTYTFFSSLPRMYNGEEGDMPYDYVLKADDDIYFKLPALIESLNKMPRNDMYYGFVIPCDSMDPFHDYMSGMGYILSWDLVEWISSSETVKKNSVGPEDMMTGQWLRDGNKGKNRYNTKYRMYDYPIPVPIDKCSHDFVPDTIAVHRLKDNLKWARALKYLNVTDGVNQRTKFYDLDCGACES